MSDGVHASSCFPCPEGTFASNQTCTPCLPGYYADTAASAQCQVCPFAKYQPELRSSSCLNCQKGGTTVEEASISKFQCISPLNNFIGGFFVGALVLMIIVKVVIDPFQQLVNDRKALLVQLFGVCKLAYETTESLKCKTKNQKEILFRNRFPNIIIDKIIKIFKGLTFTIGLIIIMIFYISRY